MPKGIPLTPQARERVREQISQAAIQLFLCQGFGRTSMRQIAEAAGMGKSTLYGYFSSKDDILLFSVDREMERLQQAGGAGTGENLRALEKLRWLVKGRAHA